MLKLIRVVCVIALAFCPVPIQAAEQGGDAEPNIDCRTAYATPAVEICATRDLRAADLNLNDAYQAEIAFIDKAAVPPDVRAKWHAALVEAQRRWIGFRDAECVLTGCEWYGGSGRDGAETACLTELTKSRIMALQHHAAAQ